MMSREPDGGGPCMSLFKGLIHGSVECLCQNSSAFHR